MRYPVRIAHVIGRAVRGGIESSVLSYYEHIDREKIQYDFLLFDDSTHIPEERIHSLGGRIMITPTCGSQPAYQKALRGIFTRNVYPLVHSHISTLSVFPLFAAWRAGIPIRVSHSHTAAGRGKGETLRNLMKYTLRNFSRTFATHFCACSRRAGEFQFGKRAMDSGRVKVWPNAIDTGRFAYNEATRAEIRKELGIEGKFVIGHAGRFVHVKNHDFLLEVFREARKMNPQTVLLLAGDGPLFNMFRDKVNELGLSESVIFAGSVPDIERYYQAMDVFIFPSLYEGLGMSAVEAELSGLPVVASTELPDDARFCDNLHFMPLKKSASEWAEEALRISDGHVRRDMSSYAREAGFDIKVQGAKLSEWYCELLGI